MTANELIEWTDGKYGKAWYWPSGELVFQEEYLMPGTDLPVGHTGYGRPDGCTRVESTDKGYWVVDSLGSFAQIPIQIRQDCGRISRLAGRPSHRFALDSLETPTHGVMRTGD